MGEESGEGGEGAEGGEGGKVGGAAGATVDHTAVGLVGGLCGEDVGAAASAGVDEAGVGEALHVVGVDVGAEALTVGAAGTEVVEAAFIPVEPEPAEVVLDETGILEAGALGIEILDAEHPAAAATFYR